MTTPDLEFDSVAIADIVQRIKCEIAYSIPDTSDQYNPYGRFQWLRYWTAKVDLTLDVNEAAALSASSQFNRLFNGANIADTKNIAQSATLSTGASVSGTAQRTDKLSFTLAFSELKNFKYRGDCTKPEKLGLLGHLGIQEWVTSSLGPVDGGQLTVGFHQAPGGSKVVQLVGPPQLGASATQKSTASDVAPVPQGFRDALTALQKAEMGADQARQYALKSDKSAKAGRYPDAYEKAEYSNSWATAANKQIATANDLIWKTKNSLLDNDPVLDKSNKDWSDMLTQRVTAATNMIKDASTIVTAAWKAVPRDAPIDSIAHTTKFTVAASGSATPNWALASVKAPGVSAPFFNSSRTRTHTLDIVMGQPTDSPDQLSQEQQRQLLNLQLATGRVIVVPGAF